MIKKFTEYKNSYSKEIIINENLQKARSILRKNKMSETNTDFQELKKLLASHPGYLGKFTDWLVTDKISYGRLVDLYTQIKDKRLSKAIDEFKTPEEVIDIIIRTTTDTAVNQMIQAIPSKAREFLKYRSSEYCHNCDGIGYTDECPECGGDESIECDKCYGDGEITCKECYGNGSKKCTKCKGRGTYYKKECDVCSGNGEIVCKSCNGEDAEECDKCKGEGTIECKTCSGLPKHDGFKCPECNSGKETDEWKEFVKFLSLQAPHKKLIIDFFSKKGGRYNGEDWDWDNDPIDDLTQIITRLIDIPSIDAIIERLPSEKNIKLIHNSDDVLIVACNYKGIVKYGSSYWCIHQNESTFNDYIYPGYDDVIEQWIVYIKGKSPLVDEKSVMGITYDIDNNNILNAHWEDDDECYSDANRILKKIKLNRSLIIGALDIYDIEESVKFKYPEIFLTTLDKMFLKTKNAIDSKVKLKRGKDPALYTIMDSIETFFDNEGHWTKELTKSIISLCNTYNIKIPVNNKSDLYLVIYSHLWNYVDFIWKGTCSENIFSIISEQGEIDDLNKKEKYNIIKWLVTNGYNIEDHIDCDDAEPYLGDLFKMNLVTLDRLMDSNVDLDNISDNDILLKIACSTLDNLNKYRGTYRMQSLLDNILYFYENNSSVLIKYKQKLLDAIDGEKIFTKSQLNNILDKVDDDDIELACAKKLFHRKIISKYDIEMKRKVLEKLISYKDFKLR